MSTSLHTAEAHRPIEGRRATIEPEPVNMARVYAMVGEDPADVREIVALYLAESEDLLRKLRAAVRSGAIDEVRRLAHRLGGASATCGMIGIVAPLDELERSGKAGRWPDNERLLEEADRQRDRIESYLSAHVLEH